MKVKDVKIGTRLGMGFGLICLALVFTLALGVNSLGRVNEGTNNIVTHRMPRVDESTRLLIEVNDISIALRNMMLSDAPADRATQLEQVTSSRKNSETILAALDKMLQSPKG